MQPKFDKLGSLFNEYSTSTVAHMGSIVNFHYIGQRVGHPIHDPYPLVLVANIYSDAISGVNLNYLTLTYIKGMINSYLDKQFTYSMIKEDKYIVGAFRSYKRNGMGQLRILDANFLKGLAVVSRSLDPGELDQIRAQIEGMIRYQMQQPVAQAGVVNK